MKKRVCILYVMMAIVCQLKAQVQEIRIAKESDGSLVASAFISGIASNVKTFDTTKGIKLTLSENLKPASYILKKSNRDGEDITSTNIDKDTIKAHASNLELYLEVTSSGKTLKIPHIGKDFKNPPLTLDSDDNRGFIYSLGTNFDFIDNIKTDKSYHNIRFSERNLNGSRVGIDVDLTRYRTFSKPDSLDNIYYNTEPIFEDGSIVGVNYLTTTSKEKSRRTLDNWSISLMPTIQLSPKSSKDFYLGFFVQFEYQRTNYEKSITRIMATDTTNNNPGWPIPYPEMTETLPSPAAVTKMNTDNFYYSGGLKMFYRSRIGILNARVGIGWSNTEIIDRYETSSVSYDAVFGYVNVEFIEYQHSGIKIGGEMRSFWGEKSPEFPLNLARFNLFIAKEISFNKIGEFLSVD